MVLKSSILFQYYVHLIKLNVVKFLIENPCMLIMTIYQKKGL